MSGQVSERSSRSRIPNLCLQKYAISQYYTMSLSNRTAANIQKPLKNIICAASSTARKENPPESACLVVITDDRSHVTSNKHARSILGQSTNHTKRVDNVKVKPSARRFSELSSMSTVYPWLYQYL